jgi:hypothetical protein
MELRAHGGPLIRQDNEFCAQQPGCACLSSRDPVDDTGDCSSGAVFLLHSMEEFSQNLIFTLPIVFMGRVSEECAQFVFADGQSTLLQYFKHFFGL